jgi:transposase
MARGSPNNRYSGDFKKQVVETMINERLSYTETASRFDIRSKTQVKSWERIYMEEGPEGLYIEKRGLSSTGRPPKLDKKVEEDLIAEVQRLRAENDYLKKLNALVIEEERRNRRRK